MCKNSLYPRNQCQWCLGSNLIKKTNESLPLKLHTQQCGNGIQFGESYSGSMDQRTVDERI